MLFAAKLFALEHRFVNGCFTNQAGLQGWTSKSFRHLLVSVKRLRELVNMYCMADRSTCIGGLVSLAVLQQTLTGFRTFK